eukprot:8149356-Pyramimonas_sp.AAC.1
MTLPAGLPAEAHTDVCPIILTLCCGRNSEVDVLELCGGSGGIRQLESAEVYPQRVISTDILTLTLETRKSKIQ